MVAKWVVELFCLHASIVSLPTAAEEGDKVKLRLATDMTEFEFALTQMLVMSRSLVWQGRRGCPRVRRGGW